MRNYTGSLNVLIPDVQSIATSFGQHNRVVPFLPGFDNDYGCTVLYARVDHVNGLRDPDEQEVIKVARKDQQIKGKFKLIEKLTYDNGKSTDYFFQEL